MNFILANKTKINENLLSYGNLLTCASAKESKFSQSLIPKPSIISIYFKLISHLPKNTQKSKQYFTLQNNTITQIIHKSRQSIRHLKTKVVLGWQTLQKTSNNQKTH
eukprot:TRINITY_DN32986_c0_g6_i1.p2 TRINITY_DN32986_c0_g6~~TRINITY_DN32986_c0_g6_i1.p2  ORF type:complete len:107 (+),score=1.06 TRINITY_DN32986_c0_g6_i1:1-321(+)